MDITLRRFCKLYTIILLTFIVEATSSNGNDTSPERRQSRVTGRIVKLYSGTRPEPILCAGEGFQADPNDCAVFYRCMKSGSGKYTVFRFQCGPGTVYDPETEVCNHPRSTKRSECGGLSPPPAATVDRLNNNEIDGTQNEIPSPITNKPIRIESTTGARVTSTTLNPWIASSSPILHTSTKRQTPAEVSAVFTSPFPWGSTMGHTNVDYTVSPFNLPQNKVTNNQQYNMVSKTTSLPTTSAIPQSNSRDNICSSDGFMGDSENCRKFYRCVANQRGSYTRFEFSCSETTVWDDDTQSCNHAWAVKRSRCGRSNTDNVFASNAEVPQKDSTTDKTVQQQLQISFGSKVTQTQTQISNGSSVIQNQTQIHYGDRLNQNKNTKAKQNQTQISHGSAVSQTQTQIDYSEKGVQTQLQIDHSQQASQSQIQIHESTTSRPLTSTAFTTNHGHIQTGNTGNSCERSGFMGDTNDCKKFYRCIDNGRGGYAKFEFSCGEGTVWDQSIEACNHAWAVKDCGGKGTAETTSTTQAAISTSHSTQNYYTTISTENHHTTSELIDTEDNEDSGYGQQNQNPTTSQSSSTTTLSSATWSSTIASPTTEKLPSNGNCQSSGFMGDANDCKIFYRCVENGKGSFTKYEFKCGEGTVWDPDIEACNHAWAVKKCGGNTSPDINNVETTTQQQGTHSTANTQSNIVTQLSTESAATQNDDYDTGYGSANNDVTSSTTITTKKPQNEGSSVGTVCTSSGFMGDKNDCKKFYRCVDNGNGGYTRYEFTCGEGTVWDSKIEACNHAWAVEECGGLTGDHQEATTQAKPTTTHEIIDSSSTEGNINNSSTLLPSTTSGTSTVTESVAMSSECTKSGFMGDQKDCKKFYRCVDNGQGSFTKYEFSCGEGTVWDQKIEACNHAWAVEKCGGSVDSSTGHHETTTQFHPTMSDEIDNGYPSNIDTGSEITTPSTTTHSTSESSKEPSVGNNCISSGFIGDKNDCKKFYRCVDDGSGKYIRYKFSCGDGTLWDQSIEACNHAWAVKDCSKTEDNTTNPSSESSTQGTLTTETEDQEYPQNNEKPSTSTASSYPDSMPGETCSKEGFMGDKRNCKKFYRCVDNGRGGFTKYEFICGEGTYWNQEILSCDHATSNTTCGEKDSSSSTQTSLPEHDEIYTEATIMSSSSTEGNVNEQTHSPSASSGICTSEGFYGDQNDCKKFYRCVDNGKGGYTKYDFTCGDGTVWDQEIQACNHESNNKKCSAGSPSTAQTTENEPDTGNDISMTTASQIQHSTEKTDTSSTSTSNSNQCSSEGFFADPNDCKRFIRCVSNEKEGYNKYEFTCGEGTIWVQEILACDHDTGDAMCTTQSTSKPSVTEGHHQTTANNELDTSTSKPSTIDKQEDEYDNGNSNKPSQSGSGDCSSEGFYGNKNDCRQFYRCVDNGQGGFTKYDFTCGDGTAWDSEIQACNHIDQVKTCNGVSETQPVMHDEDNGPSTEFSSTTSSSTSSGSTTSSATSSSTTSSSTTVSGSNNQDTNNKDTCEGEGYFGNTQDCKKFYRCVDNGKGGYTKYDYTCGDGTIWDQDVVTCNHPQDVVNPSCNQNQGGSTTSAPTATSSSSGESSATSESSASSDSSSTTSSSQSSTESTSGSSNCSQEDSSKKPAHQNITCDKAGYFANPNDCKKFYRCVDWDGDGKRFSVYHFDCGEGTIWDPAVETCNHEESVYPPRDCSGSQSQSENQPATEGTTTTQQEATSSQESTSTQTTSTTKSSTEQTTESTTSEPTTTQQSTSSEKTTTQQSTTSEQTTTQKSTTLEQTTQQSTTTEKTTQQSTTSEQTTQQSTTSEQTTQKSTTSEQTTQPPTSEQTTTQQSTTSDQTTTQQSTTSERTTTQQSTTSEPTTTEQSTTSEQTTTQQSTTSEQTTQEPTTSEQTTQEPTTSEQTTQSSTTTEQSTTSEHTTTEQSTTSESTTEQSTSNSVASTTEPSTTQQSTTTDPTEQSTTEESATSEGTTTEQSTTEQSTTEQTNENSTTESGTDESTSEKKCPETDDNQSLFVCPTSFKRHPKYCNLFYQCDEDDDTHDVKIAVFTCPNNTIYDESQTRCMEESKADKKCDGKIAQKRRFKRLDRHYKEPLVVTKDSHACPSAGYFSFEKDSECSPAFLKCKTDKTKKLRGLVYQCPSGYLYWSISKRCEPINRIRDCRRSQNNWTGRWEIPVERRNVAPS